MPIYEFKCKKCKKTFECLVLSNKEEQNVSCPKCGTKGAEKLMSVFSGGKSNPFSCSSPSSTTG